MTPFTPGGIRRPNHHAQFNLDASVTALTESGITIETLYRETGNIRKAARTFRKLTENPQIMEFTRTGTLSAAQAIALAEDSTTFTSKEAAHEEASSELLQNYKDVLAKVLQVVDQLQLHIKRQHYAAQHMQRVRLATEGLALQYSMLPQVYQYPNK